MQPFGLTRRGALKSLSCGFGYLAFAGLASEGQASTNNPLSPRQAHFPAKAKRVIFMFMHGGPSQVDTFDPKPILTQENGKPAPFKTNVDFEEKYKGKPPTLRGTPWKFAQHGESGLWISELFPHLANHADDLCVVKSMHTEGRAHGDAMLQFHTGSSSFVRPSLGAWVCYGLGSENENLPGYVTIAPPRAHGGVQNYGSAFLPAIYQGTAIGTADVPVAGATIPDLTNDRLSTSLQRKQLDFVQRVNKLHLERAQSDAQIDGLVQSYELAFRMQSIAPEVLDLRSESAETLKQYGIGEAATDNFGRQCLMARRFAEAGVRFIQISTGYGWDQHTDLVNGHSKIAKSVDQPIAGLLADLKSRGLLDDTLVLWGGEFGRTPYTEGVDGRDHNPEGFSIWMAGGGVKPGLAYGQTDDFGFAAVENKVHYHDLHATILHLLGLDHEKLTYRYAGRDFRLTDIHGRIVRDIIA